MIACRVDATPKEGEREGEKEKDGDWHKLRGLIVRDELIRPILWSCNVYLRFTAADVPSVYREFHLRAAELVTECSGNTLLRRNDAGRRMLPRYVFP